MYTHDLFLHMIRAIYYVFILAFSNSCDLG